MTEEIIYIDPYIQTTVIERLRDASLFVFLVSASVAFWLYILSKILSFFG